ENPGCHGDPPLAELRPADDVLQRFTGHPAGDHGLQLLGAGGRLVQDVRLFLGEHAARGAQSLGDVRHRGPLAGTRGDGRSRAGRPTGVGRTCTSWPPTATTRPTVTRTQRRLRGRTVTRTHGDYPRRRQLPDPAAPTRPGNPSTGRRCTRSARSTRPSFRR